MALPSILSDLKGESEENHRHLLGGEWWRERPGLWENVTAQTFADHRWQLKNSVNSVAKLREFARRALAPQVVEDLERGLALAPMNIRITPYLLSLIDLERFEDDPIRRQFLPLASEHEETHPMCRLDSLGEQGDTVRPGLIHRYPDKALFLALDVCPVYCRFCTRSYAVGSDTENVHKVDVKPRQERWNEALEYLAQHDEVEDVVLSGGDLFMLPAEHLGRLGRALLAIPHIRRIRLATKGLAVLPQKILSDLPWRDTVLSLAESGRQRGVQVSVHTHFNHPREVTEVTAHALNALFQEGVVVRNQTVLQRGVNDSQPVLNRLVRRLSWVNVQPYYVYVHDLVPGVETLRTGLDDALLLERGLRGRTAGFNTPTFVVDLPGGGGKRDAHSHEHYDPDRGIAVFRAPAVDRERLFFHFDPLRELDRSIRQRWTDERERRAMIAEVVREAGLEDCN